jgi:actin-like ATPase involved in cell morphogenesis
VVKAAGLVAKAAGTVARAAAESAARAAAESVAKSNGSGRSEAETTKLASVPVKPEPETTKLASVPAKAEPETTKLASVPAKPDPETVKLTSVPAKPEPVKPEVAAAKPEPVKPAAVAAEPEPVKSASVPAESEADAAKPDVETAKQAVVAAKPAAETAKPVPIAAKKPVPVAAKPEVEAEKADAVVKPAESAAEPVTGSAPTERDQIAPSKAASAKAGPVRIAPVKIATARVASVKVAIGKLEPAKAEPAAEKAGPPAKSGAASTDVAPATADKAEAKAETADKVESAKPETVKPEKPASDPVKAEKAGAKAPSAMPVPPSAGVPVAPVAVPMASMPVPPVASGPVPIPVPPAPVAVPSGGAVAKSFAPVPSAPGVPAVRPVAPPTAGGGAPREPRRTVAVPTKPYILGVDLGTTSVAAAVSYGEQPAMVTLGERSVLVPSMAFLEDDGRVLCGEAAQRRSLTRPERAAAGFKRRLGDPTPLRLGKHTKSAAELLPLLLSDVIIGVTRAEGARPDQVVLTHPATWGPLRLKMLEKAARQAGLGDVAVVSEPVAAAVHYAARHKSPDPRVIAVYDLGGGTFDATVLRAHTDQVEILGEPEGIERLGGVDFDEALFKHVDHHCGGALTDLDAGDPTAGAVLAQVRLDCVLAKERLSRDTSTVVPVFLPERHFEVEVTREQFEDLIRVHVESTIGALERTIRSAGLAARDLDAVVLVGGCSRIPLVSRMLVDRLDRPVVIDAHPKYAVALGAAAVAAGSRSAVPAGAPAPVTAPTAGGSPVPVPVDAARGSSANLQQAIARGTLALPPSSTPAVAGRSAPVAPLRALPSPPGVGGALPSPPGVGGALPSPPGAGVPRPPAPANLPVPLAATPSSDLVPVSSADGPGSALQLPDTPRRWPTAGRLAAAVIPAVALAGIGSYLIFGSPALGVNVAEAATVSTPAPEVQGPVEAEGPEPELNGACDPAAGTDACDTGNAEEVDPEPAPQALPKPQVRRPLSAEPIRVRPAPSPRATPRPEPKKQEKKSESKKEKKKDKDKDKKHT